MIVSELIRECAARWNAKVDEVELVSQFRCYGSDKPEGIKQVECIYTAQCFEFDYVGVIIGEDFFYNEITVRDFIQTIETDYPNFHLIMHCYLCEVTKVNLTLLEHEAARWIKLSEWNTIQWLPAADAIYERVKELIG